MCKVLPVICLLTWASVGAAQRATVLQYSTVEQPEEIDSVATLMNEILAGFEIESFDGFGEAKRALAAGARPAQELAAFERVEKLMSEGWRSYLEARASFAAARLSEARTAALTVAHLDGGGELVAEVSLRLGAAKVALERFAEAGDDFRLAHSLNPARVVDDSEFRPDVVAAVRSAIDEERPLVTAPVSLSPQQAEYSVDGVPQKEASVMAIRDGLHLVSVRSPGYQSHSRLISVSPGSKTSLAISLAVDSLAAKVLLGRRGMATGVTEASARESATALLLYSASEQILLLASVWRRMQPALLGQLCSGYPATCSPVIEVGYPKGGIRVALEQLWRDLRRARRRFPPTLQVDARVIAGERRPGGEKQPSQSSPLWRERWLWAGIAGLSVATGAWFLLTEDAGETPVYIGNRCDFGGC